MRKTILIGCSLLLAACAGANSTYTDAIKSWQGGNARDLVAAWGKPNTQSTIANGNTTYIYKHPVYTASDTRYSPQIGVNERTNAVPIITGMPNVHSPNNHTLTTYCIAIFTAAPGGKIINTAYEGSTCHIGKSETYSLTNPKRKSS